MALKDFLTPKKLGKLLVLVVVCIIFDFLFWMLSNTSGVRYETVAFTSLFLLIFGMSCLRVLSRDVSQHLRTFTGSLIAMIGMTIVTLVLAIVFSIPVLLSPNWMGIVGVAFFLSLLGKSKKRRPT